jgi:outer membrane receptor protein involved in Fe transport
MDNPYGKYIDAQDQFFRTGINYTNYVSVASRHEKGNVFLSFENNAQEGVVDMFDGYKRQNFRLNIDQQVTPWLKLSASNLFINRTTNTPGSSSGIFYAIARQEKDVDLKNQLNPDGQLYYLKSNQFNTEATNPLYPISRQKTLGKTRRWIANYTANFKFTSWADLDVTQTLEIENYRYKSVTPKDYWVQSGGTAATNGMSYNNGSMSQSTSETNTKNTQATLNLNKKFNNLGVHGKLSYLYEDRHYESNGLSASGFVISGIEQFNNFTNISGGSSSTTNERAQNYFAILGLDWKDRYLFDGMFRYDGSSLFGADARWNPYYRVSGAYRISEDVKINGIDELKIRAAYGTAGNRPSFAWQYETYNLSSGTATPSQKGNTLLKPTTTKEAEVGLNIEFLKRFRAEVTYASSSTVDQFLNVPLVAFLNGGFTSQWQNAGTVKSNTFELTLGADWVRKKDFSWTTNITFSRVRQKITELPIAPYWSTDNSNGDQDIYRIQQGEVYGAIYGHKMLRSLDEMALQLPAGKTIADYEINSEGYVIPKGTQGTTAELPITKKNADGSVWFDKIGDGNPTFIAGITNTLTFKGFQLYVLLDWKQGGDVYNGKDQRLAFNNVSAKQDMSNVPTGQKKAASYWASGMYDANFANSYWVEDGTYLKVREVALGYSVPAKALSRVFKGAIKGINAKLIGRNLFTFTGYSGYDPEVGSLRSPFDGIYANPVYRNIAFSLSFNF